MYGLRPMATGTTSFSASKGVSVIPPLLATHNLKLKPTHLSRFLSFAAFRHYGHIPSFCSTEDLCAQLERETLPSQQLLESFSEQPVRVNGQKVEG